MGLLIKANRKMVLLSILITRLEEKLALLVIAQGSALAPFIYTIF